MAAKDVRPPVRAVARMAPGTDDRRTDGPGASGTDDPRVAAAVAPETPRTLPRRRLPGRIGALTVTQLLAVEAILILVLLVLPRSTEVLAVGATVSVLLLLLTLGRSRGRWLSERILLRWRFRRRAGVWPEAAEDRRLSALRRLAPGLTVQSVDGPDGVRIGIASDGTGWFAVVEASVIDDLRGGLCPALPLDALARTVRDAEQPGTVLQVVHHRLPSPAASLAPTSPCHQSYRELTHPATAPFVASEAGWIAVRIDANTVAKATVGAPDASSEVPTVLVSVVRRVARVLKRQHVTHEILDGDRLLDALVRSLELEPRPGSYGGREQWTRWESTTLAHATFWVRDWPPLPDAGRLLDRLGCLRAAFSSTAVILEPRDNATDVRCLVRVAADPAALDDACAEVAALGDEFGARLFRLDGEHAPAAYASAPTGGGAP